MTENVYNVHQYDEEKRFALGIWTAELERILSGSESKVVALRR